MKKIIFTLFLVLVVAFGIWFFVNAISVPNIEKGSVVENSEFTPWVEVQLSGVFIKKAGEVIEHPLKNGDEVHSGDSISSDETGLAIIHLPDGSLVRLDKDSEFVLSDFSFNSEKNSLKVDIFLKNGRLWSKIFPLVSDSFWEIKTDNSVAIAKGTSFGVEYLTDKTFFIDLEGSLVINSLDLESKEPVINNTAIINGGQILEISNEQILDLISANTLLTENIQEAGSLIWERDWIKRAILQDREFDKYVSEFRDGGLPEVEIREELKKMNYQQKIIKSEQSSKGILLKSKNIYNTSTQEELLSESDY